MKNPSSPIHIAPDGIYDDGVLVLTLGLTHAAIARARRDKRLRYTRNGRRVLYRGQWIIDWLESDAPRQGGGK